MLISEVIFLLFSLFILITSQDTITLTNEINKITKELNKTFYYHRITFTNTLVFDLIKIKIDSQYNGYVYATVSNTYPYSTSYGQHKFLKNNPLIYFSRSIIPNRQVVYLGIYCETNECKYDLEIQAINLTDIQMYDNRNFILSSTYDKNATITYNTDITDLNTNNILISILGTAVMDIEMDVKYNNIDVKSYKNLPNGRTIILSSKSISSFSNSTPIKIDLNVPDNENITIINRIIPINNNNNSINNINIYDEITSFIGDNSFIKQECFKINDDVNDNNMIIYGYSSNGIYAFQANEDTYQEINTGKNIYDSDYYIFNSSKSKTFCLKQINDDYEATFHFQLLDLSNIEKGLNKTMRLVRGLPLKLYLNKNQFIPHPIETIGVSQEKQMLLLVQRLKGNPQLFPSSCTNTMSFSLNISDLFSQNSSSTNSSNMCDEYPYYCDDPYYRRRRLISSSTKLSKTKPKYRGNKLRYAFKASDFDSSSSSLNKTSQYYGILGCSNDDENNNNGCEYTIEALRIGDTEIIYESRNSNIFKKSDGVTNGNYLYYTFSINNPKIKHCYVISQSLNGDSDLSVFNDKKLSNPIGDYINYGNKEFYDIHKIDGQDNLIGTYYVSIFGNTNSYFTLQYLTSEDDIQKIYIESNHTEMEAINLGEKKKIYTLINKNVNTSNKYLLNMNILNCELKVTVNNIIYNNNKHIQIYIDENKTLYEKGEYDIDVELIKLENGRNNNYENCIFYIGGYELAPITNISIAEGLNYPFTLSNKVDKLNFIYYFMNRKINKSTGTDIIDLAILIDKIGKGTLNVTVYKNGYTNSTITISDRNNFRTFFVKDNLYICDELCYINIEVTYLNPTSSDLDFEIEIMGSQSSPFYLPIGELFLDIIQINQYQYYYSDIRTKSYGEIIINFKQGSGQVIGKIVNKKDKDENANWNKRVKLPLIEDLNNNNNNKIIEFDYYNKKLVFTEEDTENCDDGGCEIYIGILPNDQALLSYDSPYVDYSIFMRYDDISVQIPQNEFVFGSLKKTIEENETDYFYYNVSRDTNKIIIEFESDLCSLYVKKGNEKPNINNKDYEITGNNKIYELDAKYGDIFSFGVSTKNLDGYYSAFYSFKIIVPGLTNYPIIHEVDTNINEYCVINDNNQKCLFLIPVYAYRIVDMLYFYAENIDYPNDTSIKISYLESKVEIVETSTNLISLFPNNTDEIIYSKINYTKINSLFSERVYLVTVTSEKKGKLLFLTNINKQYKSTNLHPNSKQLFYLPSYPTSNATTKFNISGNDIYYLEVVALNGTGNVTLISGDHIAINSSLEKSIGSIIKPKSESNSNIDVYSSIGGINLIYYIKYKSRSSIENLDEIENHNYQIIQYTKRNDLNIFPISLFLPIQSYMNDDIVYKINLTSTNNNTDNDLQIKSYIVDKEYILNRKTGKSPSVENFEVGENDFNNKNLYGYFFFSKDKLISSTNKEDQCIYLTINSTLNTYEKMRLHLQKDKEKPNIIDPESEPEHDESLPIGEYVPLTLHKSKINSFKLEKENTSDKAMKIIISLLNGFNVIFRKYDYSNENESFTSSSDITQNVEIENETKYGKQSYKIKNLDDYTGVFVYIVNNSRRRFLQNSDEKKIMLKYNSYPSEEEIILNQFNINDDTIIAEKDDNDNVIVKINPIINSNSNQTLTNTSLYILNIYNKEDVESEDNLNSIYSEETIKNSYNNGTYTNNKIQFTIPNTTLSEKDYYIQIKAEINEEGETHSLIYKPLSYKYNTTSKDSENTTETDQGNDTENNNNNNNNYNIITITEDKKSKNNGWKVVVIVFCVIIVIVGVILFIFRNRIFKRNKNKNYQTTETGNPVVVRSSENENENDEEKQGKYITPNYEEK